MLPRNAGMFNCVTLPQNRNRSASEPVLPSIFAVVVDRFAETQPAATRSGHADEDDEEQKMLRRFAALLTLCAGLALATPGVGRAQQAAIPASAPAGPATSRNSKPRRRAGSPI